MSSEHVLGYEPGDIAEFNPADLANLVRYCVQELMTRHPYPLELPEPFDGAGIYALFYDGDFGPYQDASIRSPDATHPIYVGRARRTKSSGPRPLFNRLRDHAMSISVAENLDIRDFRCRFLVLQPLWVSTIEDLLIEHYASLWNTVISGFGVHDPGGKRHTGQLPLWDVLHPGRPHQRQMVARGAEVQGIDSVLSLIDDYRSTRSASLQAISASEVEASLISDDE